MRLGQCGCQGCLAQDHMLGLIRHAIRRYVSVPYGVPYESRLLSHEATPKRHAEGVDNKYGAHILASRTPNIEAINWSKN